jgi:hypothetical protein
LLSAYLTVHDWFERLTKLDKAQTVDSDDKGALAQKSSAFLYTKRGDQRQVTKFAALRNSRSRGKIEPLELVEPDLPTNEA